MKRGICLLAVILLSTLSGCQEKRPLRIATTTSVDNSGLLEVLVDQYQQNTGTQLHTLAVGSGRAMELVRRGDADLMLTHDPEGEGAFIAENPPLLYRKVMCSDFILVGPPDDRSHVTSAESATAAMVLISSSNTPFVSRGDRSGTHARELALWGAAGVRPAGPHLLESGQGMAATLRIASERSAYTLTDRPTFLQLKDSLDLAIAYAGDDEELLNCYAVTVRDGQREDAALQFAEWLTGGEGRDVIGSFQIAGQKVFRVWPAGSPDDRPDATPR